jgi:protoporphyrin/coproporphyrin ferrochelatase
MTHQYDSLIVVSFGGPEGPDEVIPFLENVLRGRNVPRERMLEVAHHYELFSGVSPINGQNRALIAALREDFSRNGIDLPIYFGNRNWRPYIADALTEMRRDGKNRALAFITNGFSCYSGCRQYREDIARAQEQVGEGAPSVDKLRMFYNHPLFIEAMASRLRTTLAHLSDRERAATSLAFTAHSIPLPMAQNSRYELQLHEACRLVAEAVGFDEWELVYQSRSGSPYQPWLEPDILDHMTEVRNQELDRIAVVPIGFVSDHMEILFDLDTEAVEHANEIGLELIRVPTVGTHPLFVQMIRELVLERMTGSADRPALGTFGPSHDVCPANCCLRE